MRFGVKDKPSLFQDAGLITPLRLPPSLSSSLIAFSHSFSISLCPRTIPISCLIVLPIPYPPLPLPRQRHATHHDGGLVIPAVRGRGRPIPTPLLPSFLGRLSGGLLREHHLLCGSWSWSGSGSGGGSRRRLLRLRTSCRRCRSGCLLA